MKHRIESILFVLIASTAFIDVATAQNGGQAPCDAPQLLSAADAYSFGRFNMTFQVLRPCLPSGFETKDLRTEAWRLMALSYLALDSLSAAERAIESLLAENKKYQPNPQIEPFQFVQMVEELKPKWYTWPWKGGEWYKWAGRGLLVGAAVGIPLLLKKDELTVLPGPPGNPGPN